ncbi:hypothetical protein EDD76_1238 [Kineothrix alysoides]|uniref:Uncharacterized protein n=1 Tax=Kineothrix alysoides TaxID=1469948 RepID=A0A4R1QLD7_9FIRM|nr:hypothetical protein [Kineothrix alysoides]TCL53997.1 hypothetical protein EDD76_1238 [Kineothrix alysoides]
MVYEERFIAFLNILGFKNMIESTKDNIEYQEKIKNILNYIAGIRDDNYYGSLAEYGVFKEVSVFSDSIVISYSSSLDIGGALFHVLMDLVYICNDLLIHGIYVRGGVSCGQMYHDKNVCLGPAMVKSYEIENKTAVYPRIVIDPPAFRRGLDLPGKASTLEQEAKHLKALICCDKNGIYYLDFLSQHQEFNDSLDYNYFLESIKSNIISHLNARYHRDIAQKYFWFANYYNETIKKSMKNIRLIYS